MEACRPYRRLTATWHRFRTEPLDEVETRRIADLMAGMRLYGAMVVGLLLFAAFVVRPYVPDWAVATFLVLLSIEVFVKMRLTTHFMRIAASGQADAVWRLVIVVGAGYAGVIYGAAALVMFLPMPQTTVLLLVAVYGSLLASAIWGISQYFPAAVSQAVPMSLIVIVALMLTPGVESTMLGVLLALVTLVGLTRTRQGSASVIRLIELDIENGRLLARLESERARADHERRRAEQAVIDKSLFIATASHDLRQPVHALGLYQHTLAARSAEPANAALIDAIGESSASLTALLDGLLDVSRLDARAVTPQWEVFDVSSLVDTLAREIAPSIGAGGLALDVDAAPCPVSSDRLLLERVLRNLLSNAVKFSRSGTITVTARDTTTDKAAPTVRLTVQDEGPGIPPEDVKRVFADFYRGGSDDAPRSDGSGLGLSIVARLCELLGIEVTLESEPGRGTTIRLDIPSSPHATVGAPDGAAEA